ncbi:MAG: hypothetical protein KJI69_05560 [Patescibacteria group bacterium]|nr:hypothetical protein [Patescibacteria group bacterium]
MVSVTTKRNQFRLIRSRVTGLALILVMSFLIVGVVFFPAVGNVAGEGSGASQTVNEKVTAQLAQIEDQVGDTVEVNVSVGAGEDLSELPQIVTSSDSIGTQLRDESLLPDASPSFLLNADITKIDSTGHATKSTVSFAFTPLAFVEDTTNIDFSEGFIEVRMEIEGEENVNAVLTGDFDVLIAGTTIFSNPLTLKVDQPVTDSDGKSTVLFVDPLGRENEIYTFSFEDNIDLFPDGQLTELTFEIRNVRLLSNSDQFALDNSEFFSMVINHDSSKTVIVNEKGESSLVSLLDNQLTISALPKSIEGDCIPNPPMGDVFLSTASNPSDRTKIFSAVGTGQKNAIPVCFNPLPIVSITDIARNTDYIIQFTDPLDTVEISTPNSQKNYNFSCQFTDLTLSVRECNFQ